jgi:hypothetical protein
VVIGETATVGDGSTILHNVMLGGTGKAGGDRHPKIGRHVLIGAGTQILGNIIVGNCAKIGAGSVVLRPIPSGAMAVGAPAKIIGMVPKGKLPGSNLDMKLWNVEPLRGDRIKKCSSIHNSPKISKRKPTEESSDTTTDVTKENTDHSPTMTNHRRLIHRNTYQHFRKSRTWVVMWGIPKSPRVETTRRIDCKNGKRGMGSWAMTKMITRIPRVRRTKKTEPLRYHSKMLLAQGTTPKCTEDKTRLDAERSRTLA